MSEARREYTIAYSPGTATCARSFSTPCTSTAIAAVSITKPGAMMAATPSTRSKPPRPCSSAISDTAAPDTTKVRKKLGACGVGFHSFTEAHLATDNELVRNVLLALLASLAKVEAQKISERTKAGMARAKAKSKRIGRPAISEELRQQLAARVAEVGAYAAAKRIWSRSEDCDEICEHLKCLLSATLSCGLVINCYEHCRIRSI